MLLVKMIDFGPLWYTVGKSRLRKLEICCPSATGSHPSTVSEHRDPIPLPPCARPVLLERLNVSDRVVASYIVGFEHCQFSQNHHREHRTSSDSVAIFVRMVLAISVNRG